MNTILVVEDHELNRDLLVQLLEDDYEVLTAVDGREGIDLACDRVPDFVLLDLSLPVVDGWEVARVLKGDARTQAIPIAALTSHAMAGDEERARAAGCDHYLTKPLDEDVLFALLERVLGSP